MKFDEAKGPNSCKSCSRSYQTLDGQLACGVGQEKADREDCPHADYKRIEVYITGGRSMSR